MKAKNRISLMIPGMSAQQWNIFCKLSTMCCSYKGSRNPWTTKKQKKFYFIMRLLLLKNNQ